MTEPFLKTAAPAHLLGTERGEPSPMTEDATLARASYTYWLSPPTLVERPGMRLFSGRPGLQRQVSALRLSLALRRHGIFTRCLLAGEATTGGLNLARRLGVPADVFSEPDGLQWRPSLAFAEWLADRLAGADLVHAHMFGAWWAAAQVVPDGVPLVASEHNVMTWPYGDYADAAAQAAGRVDSFFAHGPAAREFAQEPARYVAGSSVHVVPSREEALSQSAVVALGLGVPVVGTDVEGLTTTLGEGRGVLVPPEDPPVMAAALRRVLAGEQPPVEPGLAYAARYAPDLVAERYARVYRDLARAKGRRPAAATTH
jgi:Glycosyl transferases group 1